MAPFSGGLARTLPAKMAPLSGSPARILPAKWRCYPDSRLYISKNRKKNFFSYNIYGFAINRIYKKTLQYVYLSFSVGVKVVEKLFFKCVNKSRCQWLQEKKQCAMPSIAAAFVAAKRSFFRRFAWSHRHKFSYLQNFNRSWSSPAIFLTSATCRLSDLRKPPSAVEPPPER